MSQQKTGLKSRTDKINKALSNSGLTAREPDLCDAALDEQSCETDNLIIRQDV